MIGFENFINKVSNNLNETFWEKYPNISKINPEDITIELIRSFIQILKQEKSDIVITPRSLMQLNGAPVNDKNWMNKQDKRIEVLKQILQEIEEDQIIIEIQKGYRIANA